MFFFFCFHLFCLPPSLLPVNSSNGKIWSHRSFHILHFTFGSNSTRFTAMQLCSIKIHKNRFFWRFFTSIHWNFNLPHCKCVRTIFFQIHCFSFYALPPNCARFTKCIGKSLHFTTLHIPFFSSPLGPLSLFSVRFALSFSISVESFNISFSLFLSLSFFFHVFSPLPLSLSLPLCSTSPFSPNCLFPCSSFVSSSPSDDLAILTSAPNRNMPFHSSPSWRTHVIFSRIHFHSFACCVFLTHAN